MLVLCSGPCFAGCADKRAKGVITTQVPVACFWSLPLKPIEDRCSAEKQRTIVLSLCYLFCECAQTLKSVAGDGLRHVLERLKPAQEQWHVEYRLLLKLLHHTSQLQVIHCLGLVEKPFSVTPETQR